MLKEPPFVTVPGFLRPRFPLKYTPSLLNVNRYLGNSPCKCDPQFCPYTRRPMT
jgi:hypothetical protein